MIRMKRAEQFLWIAVLTFAAAVAFFFVIRNRNEKVAAKKAITARYTAFGIDIPTGYRIHGIDVSAHQGPVFWPAVAKMKIEGIQMGFSYMKATEGLDDADKRYKHNMAKAKASGMVCGAYHFFLATKSGKAQARNFIKNVQLHKGDLPPVVDVEKLYGVKPALMRARLKEYLGVIEAYYKVKPMIYSYVDFYERNLGKEFEEYPLWVAHYFEPESPRIKRNWTFWQHSDIGRVNGINATVDCNVFNGDSASFIDILIGQEKQ